MGFSLLVLTLFFFLALVGGALPDSTVYKALVVFLSAHEVLWSAEKGTVCCEGECLQLVLVCFWREQQLF